MDAFWHWLPNLPNLQPGTWGDWVSGAGSVVATAIALSAFLGGLRDRRRREELDRYYQRRAQASKVFVEAAAMISSVEEIISGTLIYAPPAVHNRSDSVIHDLRLTLEVSEHITEYFDGKSSPHVLRLGRLLPGDVAFQYHHFVWRFKGSFEGYDPNGEEFRGWVDEIRFGGAGYVLVFRDAVGALWKIDRDHRLDEIRDDPNYDPYEVKAEDLE